MDSFVRKYGRYVPFALTIIIIFCCALFLKDHEFSEIHNKAMKRPVFQTNNLEEAIDYTRRHPRKSRRHCIYDDKLKTFDIKKIRLAAGI